MSKTRTWTIRKVTRGKEGHPESITRARKEDAFTAARTHVKELAGNSASVFRTKDRRLISSHHSEKVDDEVVIHEEIIEGAHQDGSRIHSRVKGSDYRWSSSNNLKQFQKKL